MIGAAAFLPNTPTLIGDMGVDHRDTIAALRDIGKNLSGRIDTVVIMSPHFQTSGSFGIVSAVKLKQIYDFYGFPEEFYRVRYEPPGDPETAIKIVRSGIQAGIRITETDRWGLDHGAWSPLYHIFPEADIPIIPVSICPDLGAQAHKSLGALLRSDFSGQRIFAVSTGSFIHRLDLFQSRKGEVPQDAMKYLDLCISSLNSGRWEDIWNADPKILKAAAPEGYNLPLKFLEGVVGSDFRARILSNEVEFNASSLTTVLFE